MEIRPGYKFDVSCQGSVPEAIISFLESSDYEDAIRNAVSLGGDSDTIACITGGIAQAFYKGAPPAIIEKARAKLTKKMIKILDEFNKKYKL
ncbi:MAG: ADP-ribosylglycohydrolase family protein [Elusimicrobiales bacterium]|nr:ADP-ribosylglycohydrolase family protein [Elusimicrobiales bacterium]